MLGILESLVGRQVERSIGPLSHRLRRGHHARDLEAGGVDEEQRARARGEWWGDEPVWYPDGTPPRRRNRITPLIDGANYLPALRAALRDARSSVTVAGWCLTPHVPLTRDNPQLLLDSRLLPELLEVARRVPVRLLLWGGAPAFIQPTTRAAREVKRALDEAAAQAGVDLRCELDCTAHASHCHHQKTVVVDDRIAFLGGMDITTFQGDRWDRPGHPLRAGLNWHDVQARIEGEAVADVARNFRQRWEGATGAPLDLPEREPAVDETMTTPAQIVRTIPARTYDALPKGEFGIYHAYLEVIRRARRYIYCENQYLWSPDVVEALCDKIEHPPAPDFRIVVVLPARAYSGKWDNDRHVKKLREADDGRGMFEAYSLYASGPHLGLFPFRYRPVYVHAKVAMVDDEWCLIGSANLNTRGLVTDSEIDVLAHDRELARELRISLWAEHLALPREEVAGAAPAAVIDGAWRERAAENAKIMEEGVCPLPSNVHRYQTGRVPGAWFLEEAETLTFEH